MKKLALAAALSLAVAPAPSFAGNLAEPATAPIIVPQAPVQEAGSSAGSGNSAGSSGGSGLIALITLGAIAIGAAAFCANSNNC